MNKRAICTHHCACSRHRFIKQEAYNYDGQNNFKRNKICICKAGDYPNSPKAKNHKKLTFDKTLGNF